MDRRLKWGMGIAFGCVVVCGGGCAGLYGAFAWRLDPGYAAGDYEAAKREYRELGLPWTARELEPKPPIAPGEDATPILQRVGKEFDGKAFDRDAVDLFPDDPKAARVLRRFDRSLDGVSAILGKRRLYIAREWDRAMTLEFAEFKEWKRVAKALSLRAQTRAVAGDRRGATRDLRTILALGPLIQQDPVLLAGLVAIALDGIGHDAVRRVGALRPEWAAGLQELVPERRPYDPRVALRGEAFYAVTIERNLERYGGFQRVGKVWGGSDAPPEIPVERLQRNGDPEGRIARSQTASLLRFYSTAEREAERARASGREGAPTEAGQRIDAALGGSRRMSRLLTELGGSVIGRAFAAYDRNVADRRLTRLYLQLLAKKNALPRTGWMPKEKDPWGRPYDYQRTQAGFRLYSYGPNGKDEGGLLGSERSAGYKSDDPSALYPPLPSPAVKRAQPASP